MIDPMGTRMIGAGRRWKRRIVDRGAARTASETGVALLTTLVLPVAVLVIGISAARLALHGEKAARGERDRQMAFQAAEEALMDAENDIEGSKSAPGRSAMFAPDSALGFVDGCGAGAASANLGLCLRDVDEGTPVWKRVDLADDGAGSHSVPFGQFTGAAMPTGEGFLPFKRPRYVIELLPYAAQGEDAGVRQSFFYRVTAIGFGSAPGSEVVLQSVYRKQIGHGSKK